jgi:hypothetical protein
VKLLRAAEEELAYTERGHELYTAELEGEAIPELLARFEEEKHIWENLPRRERRRTLQPELRGTIILFRKGSRLRGYRYSHDLMIKVEDVHSFRNERVSWRAVHGAARRVREFEERVREFQGTWTEELTGREIKDLGFNPSDFESVRREV